MTKGDRVFDRDELIRHKSSVLAQTARERWTDRRFQDAHMLETLRILKRLMRAKAILTEAERDRIYMPPVRQARVTADPKIVSQRTGHVKF